MSRRWHAIDGSFDYPQAAPAMTLHFSDLLSADHVHVDINASSKKHAIELLSDALASSLPDASVDDVFHALLERERLGCTASTGGVALPHARLAGVSKPLAVMLRLNTSIDFDSTDGTDVDVLFGFLVPLENSDDVVRDIHRLTASILNDELIDELRAANDAVQLYDTLLEGEVSATQFYQT
ncbi:MAG: PTS sugar transporter subunit IIA [Pseudomonadota bacterium]